MQDNPLLNANWLVSTAANLGMARKLHTAVAVAERALRLNSKSAISWHSLGHVHLNAGNFEEAVSFLSRAAMMEPHEAGHQHNLGLAYMSSGRFAEAQACFDKALELDPTMASIAWDRALSMLTAGDWEAGWKAYEYRKKYMADLYPRFMQPMWRGEPLEGKSIYIQCEQGDGDILMFQRYLSLLKDMGAKVYLGLPTQFIALFRTCPYIDHITLLRETIPETDYAQFLCSLPYLFQTTVANTPNDPGFVKRRGIDISVDLPDPIPGNKKVGIVWAGSTAHMRDAERSAVLENFLLLIGQPDITLYSLQMGERAKDIQRLGASPFIIDLFPLMSDWTVTNGMVAQMDYIITVDTSIAHLAGLNDIPTYMLVSKVPDYRWLYESTTTPWYPSMRLFRQGATERNYEGAMRRVCEALVQDIDGFHGGKLDLSYDGDGGGMMFRLPKVEDEPKAAPIESNDSVLGRSTGHGMDLRPMPSADEIEDRARQLSTTAGQDPDDNDHVPENDQTTGGSYKNWMLHCEAATEDLRNQAEV